MIIARRVRSLRSIVSVSSRGMMMRRMFMGTMPRRLPMTGEMHMVTTMTTPIMEEDATSTSLPKAPAARVPTSSTAINAPLTTATPKPTTSPPNNNSITTSPTGSPSSPRAKTPVANGTTWISTSVPCAALTEMVWSSPSSSTRIARPIQISLLTRTSWTCITTMVMIWRVSRRVTSIVRLRRRFPVGLWSLTIRMMPATTIMIMMTMMPMHKKWV
mmetsp:Transcript_5299/g.11672  ORF Transcript_5299/g.11672 Transcript_5299/m.11672 type:complete len:216 (-) Transcript_5299:597-1244(-)